MLCEKEVQQLWSPGLEKFLADRFVEGTCPLVSHFFTYLRGLRLPDGPKSACGTLVWRQRPSEMRNPL